MDRASNWVAVPVPETSMVVAGAVTSRGSSGVHWPVAVVGPTTIVTALPVVGSSTGCPLAPVSGTWKCTTVSVAAATVS